MIMDELRERLNTIRASMDHRKIAAAMNEIECLLDERDAARERIAELEAALREILDECASKDRHRHDGAYMALVAIERIALGVHPAKTSGADNG